MSVSEAAILVARFLRTNNYNETLDAFLKEANLPPTTGSVNKGDLTLEKVLEEKRIFDISLQFEKLGNEDGDQGWSAHAPAVPDTLNGPSRSNILHLSLPQIIGTSGELDPLLVTTTADRRLNLLQLPTCTIQASLLALHDSPILSSAVLKQNHLITTSMSGQLTISDFQGNIVHQRRDHLKYVVQVVVHETEHATWIATAGWDAKVHVYKLDNSSDDHEDKSPGLDAPVASISLPSNPESILFIQHPDDGHPVLIVTRRDSTHLFYYNIDAEARLLGKQNLAPHSNAWIAFTPSAIAICPTDSTLLAVATSAMPHMKLLMVRLMVPPVDGEASAVSNAPPITSTELLEHAPATQASQARAALALQEREGAAILIHCTTMAPQTAYSTPSLAWRPDGSGVWVNSDDGVIRGIEVSSGKIVATLKGHDVSSKIRCLCTGLVVKEGKKEEWLFSGGFDQKLIVWKPET